MRPAMRTLARSQLHSRAAMRSDRRTGAVLISVEISGTLAIWPRVTEARNPIVKNSAGLNSRVPPKLRSLRPSKPAESGADTTTLPQRSLGAVVSQCAGSRRVSLRCGADATKRPRRQQSVALLEEVNEREGEDASGDQRDDCIQQWPGRGPAIRCHGAVDGRNDRCVANLGDPGLV